MAPLRIFICHESSDKRYLIQLRQHLSPLVERGVVCLTDATMTPMEQRTDEYESAKIAEADILLLLVSASFVSNKASVIPFAISQIERGAKVVPILVRPIAVEHSGFDSHAILPKNQRPVCLWRSTDAAWRDVVSALPGIPADSLTHSSGRPEAAPSSRVRRLTAVAVGVTTLACLAAMACLWLTAEAPFPPHAAGIVVVGHLPSAWWSNSTFHSICRLASAREPQAVHCILGRSLEHAYSLGAALVIDVPEDHEVRLATPPGQQVLVPLGTIAMPKGDAPIVQLVAVALQLSRWFVDGVAPQALPRVEVPMQSPHEVGESVAILSAYVRWRQAEGTPSARDPGKTERVYVAETAAQCAERPHPSWTCQIAQFLYAVDCPGCPGSRASLVQLSQGDGPLRFFAQLELAEQLCRTSPKEAAQILETIVPPNSCFQVSLMGVASCILSGRPEGLSQELGTQLRRWAEADPLAVPGCPSAQVSAALGWRGIYASLQGDWRNARINFRSAYERQPRSVWLLMEAEAALQLRDDAAVLQILRSANLRMITEPRHQVLAYFLRYLARLDDAANARYLEASFAALPAQTVVLTDEGATLKSLACRISPATACQVYTLLTTPQTAASAKELQLLLGIAAR